MAVRKSKEHNFQVNGNVSEIKEKCLNALNNGGFSKVSSNDLLNEISANYKKATVVGKIQIVLAEQNDKTNINVKSTANSDNIFALFSSPNDKIMNAFKENLG